MTPRSSSLALARAVETVLSATAFAQHERGFTAPSTTRSDAKSDLVPILRENLRAASQHVALGHESASFRDCPYPGCLDAANRVRHLETVEECATDSELEMIFDRVQAALEAGAFTEETSELTTDDDDSPPEPMLK